MKIIEKEDISLGIGRCLWKMHANPDIELDDSNVALKKDSDRAERTCRPRGISGFKRSLIVHS